MVGAGSAGVRYQGIYRVRGNTVAVNMLQNKLDKVGLMWVMCDLMESIYRL